MGSLFAVIPRLEAGTEAEALFQRATRAFERQTEPDPVISNGWSYVASGRRRNGSGSPVAMDRESGSWLAVAGTVFHQSGNNHTEYLLQQYLKVGAVRLAHDLDGFFVIIAGNSGAREVVVISDVVGSLHVYYREFAVGIALSTSSLALAELAAVSLDPVGCQEFLGTGVMYEDRTFYNEVRKLPPATITTFQGGHRAKQERYWDLSTLTPESLSPNQATDLLWETLTSAISRVNRHFDSIVSDLTGGYDSRALTAALLHGQKKFATAVSGPATSADVVISRGLAAMLGLEHIHNPPNPNPLTAEDLQSSVELTDGECDVVEYSRVARIHTELSRRFQVSLNGSFGEVARGYWWELLFPHIGARRKLDSHKLASKRYALGSCAGLFQPQYRVNLAEHMAGVVERTISGLESYPNTFQMDAAYLRMRMQRWQGRIASSTNRIWPCLSPFMFRTVLETMLQARHGARERSLLVRLMLAKYQPRLAAYPLEHGYPALPATWKNFPRFWPLVPYYAGKVVRKLSPRTAVQDQPTEAQRLRTQLWQLEEVRGLLRPEAMKSLAVLDRATLATFLDASQQAGFSQDAAWRRLLTLEWALAGARVNR